jgi:hypothetical protein
MPEERDRQTPVDRREVIRVLNEAIARERSLDPLARSLGLTAEGAARVLRAITPLLTGWFTLFAFGFETTYDGHLLNPEKVTIRRVGAPLIDPQDPDVIDRFGQYLYTQNGGRGWAVIAERDKERFRQAAREALKTIGGTHG